MNTRVLYVVLQSCLLLLYSTVAHASGDPMIVFWIAGAALVQIAVLIFMLTAQVFRRVRTPAVVLYILYLPLLWAWIWQSTQSVTVFGVCLMVLPCLVVGVLRWLVRANDRR